MRAAALPRCETVLWNVIPAWNGTRKLTGNEMKGAADELSHLL
jgi:hypothetical protein